MDMHYLDKVIEVQMQFPVFQLHSNKCTIITHKTSFIRLESFLINAI